jgi:hypothetical protein
VRKGQKTRQKAFVAVSLAVLALVGCGGGTKTVTETSVVPTDSTEPQYEGKLPPGVTDDPSRDLIAEWPERWCQVKPGFSRLQVSRIMGAVPTEADSGKIPHIPYIKLNENGENENEAPPTPAGSDTWEAPGSYQFNAFYDPSLHVQQLDFGGPDSELPCATTRVSG